MVPIEQVPVILAAVTAVVKALGLFVVLPILVYKLVRNPPEWLASWRRGRAKISGIEMEFERVIAEHKMEEVASSMVLVSESATVGDQESADGATGGPTPNLSPFALINEGKYLEAVESARLEMSSGKGEREVSDLAFLHFWGYRKGFGEALQDLERLVAAHHADHYVRYWYARALVHANASDRALVELSKIIDLFPSETVAVDAGVATAQILKDEERHPEAHTVLSALLSKVSVPTLQARLYAEDAEVWAAQAPANMDRYFLMMEEAVRNNPNELRLRFDLAYKYSESLANNNALYHYRELLSQSESNSTYHNNAGVAAEALSLPIAAVEFFRSAGALGSTLAMSNLATRFLTAGFSQEARTLLSDAQEHADVDRRVLTVMGHAAKAEDDNESRLKSIEERCSRFLKWRHKEADAIRTDTAPSPRFVGVFAGTPSEVTLEPEPDGSIKGTFAYGWRSATLVGQIVGAALLFTWSTTEKSSALTLLSGKVSGFGLLLWKGDSLVGYVAEGERSPDTPKELKEFALVAKGLPLISSPS